MDTKSSGPGAKPTQAKPLGVDDIPGAIPPEEATSSGQQGAAPAAGGQRGARGAEIGRLRDGMGGGGAGGQQGNQLARLRAMLGRSGDAGGGRMGGGGDPQGGRMGPGRMGGREMLEQLKSRLNADDGGENNQQRKRLAAAVNRIAEDYAKLEQEVERLKGELADAEEKIRILNYEDQ